MSKTIRKMFEMIAAMFHSILTGSKVSMTGSDGIQVSKDGEVYDGLQVASQYGFYSLPPVGSDVLLLSNGDTQTKVIIAAKKGALPSIKEGEACVYSAKRVLIKAPKIAIGQGENELIGLLSKLLKEIPKLTTVDGKSLNPSDVLQNIAGKLEAMKA